MASGTVTVTAKAGPAIQATSLAIANVSSINFDLAREVVQILVGGSFPEKEFDFASVATITFTVTAANGNATIALS